MGVFDRAALATLPLLPRWLMRRRPFQEGSVSSRASNATACQSTMRIAPMRPSRRPVIVPKPKASVSGSRSMSSIATSADSEGATPNGRSSTSCDSATVPPNTWNVRPPSSVRTLSWKRADGMRPPSVPANAGQPSRCDRLPNSRTRRPGLWWPNQALPMFRQKNS